MSSISPIMSALGPVFVLIALGYGLRRALLTDDAFWSGAERLTYFCLFPAMLVTRLANASMLGQDRLGYLFVALACTLGLGLALLLGRRAFPVDGPGFSSVFQGGIRFNTYVGMAAAASVFGPDGLDAAALLIAFLIPLVNILSVVVLARFAGSKVRPKGIALALLRNPLILACTAGIVLNAGGFGLPTGTQGLLSALSGAALPLGLLCVGAGLKPAVAARQSWILAVVCLLKLVVLPALTAVAAAWVGLNALETGVLVLFAALPGAPTAYVLARQMGGDETLVAAIVTAQTLLAIITLPLILALL